ncbi:hypothetical protein NKH91_06000 [Mesorhizobium sp. M0894]|uniref:hypothetical protein n=1 Tax=unclassified Mesorhizobium TaxID=325217 RepID=UPI00333A43D9
MQEAIRLAHCFGAILTGIVILVLAVAISATHGSTFGVGVGFQALVAGYAVGVNVTNNQHPRTTITLALFCWASTLVAILAALNSMI